MDIFDKKNGNNFMPNQSRNTPDFSRTQKEAFRLKNIFQEHLFGITPYLGKA